MASYARRIFTDPLPPSLQVESRHRPATARIVRGSMVRGKVAAVEAVAVAMAVAVARAEAVVRAVVAVVAVARAVAVVRAVAVAPEAAGAPSRPRSSPTTSRRSKVEASAQEMKRAVFPPL